MANTFSSYCREYINNQQTVLTMFNTYALTMDLVKPLLSHRGKYISYDQVVLGSGMGDYNRDSGYVAMDFTANRVERELTQDKGNKLAIDLMDQDEAQIEGGTVRLFNQYVIKNAIPTIDAYRFAKLIEIGKGQSFTAHASLTASNILAAILGDKAKIENKRVKWEECIIYIDNAKLALLEEASFGRGYITVGGWNGNLDVAVKQFFGAKIVGCPTSQLGCEWVIVHPLACDAFIVYEEAQFFDRIPGFGGRRGEVDVGLYHDCFINPNGGDGILVAFDAVPKVALPDDFTFDSASGKIAVSNVAEGAKVYYGTSTGITPSSTELVAESDGVYRLPSVSSTTTYYVIQVVNGVSSAENTVKATKN